MAESKQTSSNMDSAAYEKAEKVDNRAEKETEEKKQSEVQKDGESTTMNVEGSKVSEKETVAEEKSPEPKSSTTSDTTSGIESRAELDTPPEVAETEAAKTSDSRSEPPSVSGAEGTSTSGIQGSSPMETQSPPLDEHEEVSPTKKSKASSFTGAIRKIISPRKKDRSHEDEVTSPKDKQKGKSFLKNPLKSSKSMSLPNKSTDVSSVRAGKEAPDVIPPTFSPPKAAKGTKAVSPSVTSPTKKSGKKGFTRKIKKSFSAMFKKTGSGEGLYMPEDAAVAAAQPIDLNACVNIKGSTPKNRVKERTYKRPKTKNEELKKKEKKTRVEKVVRGAEKSKKKETGNFKCPKCNACLSSKDALRRHTNNACNSNRTKDYQCEVCRHSFSRKEHLDRHSKKHTGEKLYKCEICNKAFGQKGSKEEHERTHVGEKNFVCAYCLGEFTTSGQRKRHMRQHTGEKPYQCCVCFTRFRYGSGMHRHVAKCKESGDVKEKSDPTEEKPDLTEAAVPEAQTDKPDTAVQENLPDVAVQDKSDSTEEKPDLTET